MLKAGGRKDGNKYILDIEGEPVEIGRRGLTHGLHNEEKDLIYPILSEVMKSAVRVNELEVRKEYAGEGEKDDQVLRKFVYLGAAANGDEIVPVRIQIDQKRGRNQVGEIDVLKSLNAKIGTVAARGGLTPATPVPTEAASPAEADLLVQKRANSPVAISISDLVRIAQPLHPEIFSRDVAMALGVPCQGGEVQARYSRRLRDEVYDDVLKAVRAGGQRVAVGKSERTEAGFDAGANLYLEREGQAGPSQDGSMTLAYSEALRLYRALAASAHMPKVLEKMPWLASRDRKGRLRLNAAAFGIVDRSGLEAVKESLKKDGLFMHEDAAWRLNSEPKDLRALGLGIAHELGDPKGELGREAREAAKWWCEQDRGLAERTETHSEDVAA